MTIKKAYVQIVDFLEANGDKKVKTIISDVIAMASARTGGGGGKATAFHKDENGVVVAVKCFYHKLWMSPQVVDFGAKASSATGLNSMCKDGVSKWTKRDRAYKAGKEALLEDLMNPESGVSQDNLADAMAALDTAKTTIIAREDGYGFESLEDCLADLESR